MDAEQPNNNSQDQGAKLKGGGRRVVMRGAAAEQTTTQHSTSSTKGSSNKSPRKRQQQHYELGSATDHSLDSEIPSSGKLRVTSEDQDDDSDSSSSEEQPLLLRSLRNRTIVKSNNSERTPTGSTKSKTMKQRGSCDSWGAAGGDSGKIIEDNKKETDIASKSHKKSHPSNHCCAQNRRQVLDFADAPSYLKFNPYITGGYRTALTPRECVKSLFWWTNETLNIWSHLLGWMFFLGLSIYDSMGLVALPNTHPWDRAIVVMLLIAFQACMLLSALYHVFCCCSERFYRRWLSADLFGVSLSLLAIYVSGIYYAFSCVPIWLNFYLITVGVIFVSAMVLQIIPVVKKPTTAEAFHWRLVVFGGWAAYGIVPTMHWAVLHGGTSSPVVSLLLPRIFAMYGISMAAFFFYVLRVPEKLYPGLVNFIGSSHQIWHCLIVVAFYHWHNTGILYLQFRANNLCQDEYAFLYSSSSSSAEQTVEAK